MQFGEYSIEAEKTATYPGQGQNAGVIFTALGLAGEAGEVANVVRGLLKDGVSEDAQDTLIRKIGNALWFLDRLADEVGVSLAEVAELNVDRIRREFVEGPVHSGR